MEINGDYTLPLNSGENRSYIDYSGSAYGGGKV
jgi:hypothetical protein